MLEPSGQRYPPFLACFSLPNNTACWSVLTSTKQPFFKCFLVASALRLWLQSISKRSRLVVIIIIFIHDFIMIIDCHQHHKFIRFKCQAKKSSPRHSAALKLVQSTVLVCARCFGESFATKLSRWGSDHKQDWIYCAQGRPFAYSRHILEKRSRVAESAGGLE